MGEKKIYDVVIIGAGPAGLSAGIYCGRSRLDTLIIEKAGIGGQITLTPEIDNYPGSLGTESGTALTQRMLEQAQRFGVSQVVDDVVKVELDGDIKTVYGQYDKYHAKAIIIAGGSAPAKLNCPGEDEYTGKGVSYCATCDGAFFGGLEVFVVGGGDSAVGEAIYLTDFARKVTIIHRRDELRAAKAIQESAFSNEKIDFMWDSVVKEIKGEAGLLTEIVVENVKTGDQRTIKADPKDGTMGVFVFIGNRPQTGAYEGLVEMENGFIVTDDDMRTNIPGVFAAGDIRAKKLRQVVTAAADGAIAAAFAGKFVKES
ncbi:MAG: thioredoxin-disulfide reductase [Anaerovoracaceae bacterium]|jgi:thioredoxin reductase (NADPH)